MESRAVVVEVGKGQSVRGASARERALRFNRGIIGLGLITLAAIFLLPV